MRLVSVLLLALSTLAAQAAERQLTFTPHNHDLDNNDNFSYDGRCLVYDNREFAAPGIDNADAIEMVDVTTGEETVLYQPAETIVGVQAAPGVGAVSFSPVAMEVIFIHGPLVKDVPERGCYAKPNRNGACVPADGSGRMRWLDYRDVATDRPTTPGAHRGGTHRHEFSRDGRRIGLTYDDYLLPGYGRTIGLLMPHEDAPGGATHWFANLVPVVPGGGARPGEIERCWGDSWVDAQGTMRAFIGKVCEADGSYEQSLFVIDLPEDLDITTADSGTATRYPAPPEGVRIRRLTRGFAEGVVRGSYDGTRIAYYGKDDAGRLQVWVIPADGSAPGVQVSRFPEGADLGLRWHPSGAHIICVTGNVVTALCVEEGPRLGETTALSGSGGGPRKNPVVSPDGRLVAWNQPVPTPGPDGEPVKTYNGSDVLQIVLAEFGG